MIEDILLKTENHILEFGRHLEVIQTAFRIDKRIGLSELSMGSIVSPCGPSQTSSLISSHTYTYHRPALAPNIFHCIHPAPV